jgi:hypothetical protein
MGLSRSTFYNASPIATAEVLIRIKMDGRIGVAPLKSAIRGRQPPNGCIHHSGSRFPVCLGGLSHAADRA